MKKIIALVLALAMVLMVGAAFADEPTNYAVDKPNTIYEGDTGYDNTFTGVKDASISISGLSAEGDAVYFYKVIGVNPDAAAKITDTLTETKAAGWEVVAPFNTGANAITVDEFKAILTTGITDVVAGKIAQNATGRTEGTYSYKGTAGADKKVTISGPDAGLYVAIVVPATAGIMFNPVFVAADYYSTTGGDKSSNWEVDFDLSYSNKAMAKKDEVTVTKEATEHNEDSYETNDAKAVAVGDQIDFTIKTTIPEFASNYLKPLFVVNDTMTTGLAVVADSVKVYEKDGETEIAKTRMVSEEEKTNYTITYTGTTAYKVKFDPDYLLGLEEAKDIVIKYSATVTETAVTHVNEEDNTVTVEYSHEPSVDDEGEGKKVGDKTHHYTFTIDGTIWGSKEGRRTEVVKVGVDKDGNEITETKEIDNGKEVGALKDAEFKLYTDASCSENSEYNKGPYKTAKLIVSDEYGRLNIKGSTGISGLDAGTYYLKETKAPDGYIKDQTATKIVITPDYYAPVTWSENGIQITSDDILKSYTVAIDGVVTATYTLNYTMNSEGTLPINDVTTETEGMKTGANITISNTGLITVEEGKVDAEDDDGKIVNTRGVELPSTGGIGTTIFYIVGGLLLVGAAVILVARKKSND